jgi:MFS transporter, PPP family, 3-phenylpropionic acid transporter
VLCDRVVATLEYVRDSVTAIAPTSAAPPRFKLRCSLAYAAPTSLNGILLPHLPIWLQSLSFSPLQIGMILAAQVVLRVFSAPLTGHLIRSVGEPNRVLVSTAALSLVVFVGLFLSHEFWLILIVIGLQAAIFAPYTPIVESIAVSGVKRWGFQYGRMRVWGSIGFVAATLATGGLTSLAGLDMIPVSAMAALLFALAVAFAAPKLKAPPVGGQDSAKPRRRPSRLDVHVLLIGVSLIQSSHGMFYGFSAIQWQAMGYSGTVIAALWSVGVVAEIAVFFMAGRLAKRWSPWTLMRIGCLAAVIRWALFPFDWSAWGYGMLQLGHAFSFALVHLGLQYRLAEVVEEEEQASAQGNYIFYSGAFLALSTLLSGVLYRHAGLHGYLAMALLALAGLGVLHIAARLQPQRSGAGG